MVFPKKKTVLFFSQSIVIAVSYMQKYNIDTWLQGQYGRVMGYIEPLDPEDVDQDNPEKVVFANEVFGNAIPPSFLPACEKGFREACNAGALINHPVEVWFLIIKHGPGAR